VKYIKKIETESCPQGNSFDIVYLVSGSVIVINDERIGVYQTESGFNSGTEDPEVIELENNNNLNSKKLN
jgi:hypothetical protein